MNCEVSFKEKGSNLILICSSGSFNVVLNDGNSEVTYNLNRSYNGLYVPNQIWRSLENFSTNSLALIVSNIEYNQQDYIKIFKDFKILKHEK